MAATEELNYGNKSRGVERRRLQNEETAEEKTLCLNTKENLQNYYKNIEAYNEAERLLTAKPTEGIGFQTSDAGNDNSKMKNRGMAILADWP